MQYQYPQIETSLVAEPANAAFRIPDPSIFDPPATGNRTFGARARMRTTGWIAGAGNVVRSAEDAASLLADIRKNAQETVYSVVTDRDGLVLEIHRYSKGTSGAAPLNAVEFVGRAINIPGAAKLYWAHNHPGGSTSPSREDHDSHRIISRLARLGGMETVGIVIAGTQWTDLDNPSTSRMIRPALRKVKVPVKERTVAGPPPAGESPFRVNNSSDARRVLKEAFADKEGWLLLDIRNRVVGFQDFVPGRGAGGQAAGLVRTAERVNASRAIFFSRTEPAPGTERAKFLRGVCSLTRTSLALLDVLYDENGSMADRQRMKEITHTAFPDLDFEILREDRPVFWKEPASPWYSRMRAYLAEKLPDFGPGPKLADAIESWAKKGLIKAEELEWTGLADWLRAQPGKVSKVDVLAFIDEHDLKIEEIVKGETIKPVYRIVNWMGEVIDDGFEARSEAEKARDEMEKELGRELFVESSLGVDELTGEPPPDAGADETRFAQYQLPGGENYRELLITMPVDQTPARAVGFNIVRSSDGRLLSQHTTRESAEYRLESGQEIVPVDKYGSDAGVSGSNTFKTGHWPGIPNVLAHVRFNERTGPSGERILFIEEVQSDWHQKGRKEGYKTNKKATGYTVRPNEKHDGYWDVIASDGSVVDTATSKAFAEQIAFAGGDVKALQDSVPDAPWKKTWPLKVIQRMVRYAAENGFDAIAWTPGEVQAERYDLSKQLSRVEWEKHPADKNKVTINVFDKEENGVLKKTVSFDELPDIIGKELAEKIATNKENEGELSGLDLKIGGEGLQVFYDKILPAQVNQFFGKKAWGGPKVGMIEIETRPNTGGRFEVVDENGEHLFAAMTEDRARAWIDEENEGAGTVRRLPEETDTKVWRLPITAEMKNKALTEGMPLFYRGATRARRFLGANPKARVFKTVAEAMRYWKNPPPIRICGSERELPPEIAMFARAGEAVYGAFWNGTVYLVADRLPDRDTTLKALFHEVIGHYGLSLLGEAGQRFLNRLYRSKLPEIRELASRQNIRLDDDSGRRLAAEEWLAGQAATRPRATWVDRGVRTVKNWIRDKLRIDLKVSDREVRAWLADMRRVVVQGPDGEKKPVRAREARFFAVYHGTPHVWPPEPGFPHGRPRLDKIGTGEGAAAYGWGWYSAEVENTALSYQASTLSPRITIRGVEYRADADGVLKNENGKTIDSLPVYLQAAARALIGSRAHQPVEVLAEEAESYLQARTGLSPTKIAKIKEAILNGEVALEAHGNAYKLDLPDDVPEKLLDWDKPLSEQSEHVRMALARADTSWAKHLRGEDQPDFVKAFIPATGGEAYGHLAARPLPTGQGKKAASEYLASLGVVGCRYADHGSRGVSSDVGGSGGASFNYVVWDQGVLDRVSLIARNGERLDEVRVAEEEPNNKGALVQPRRAADLRPAW